MASGKTNFLASSLLLLCSLGLTSTALATAGNSKDGSVDKKNVIITGERIEVIISSTKEDTNVSLEHILQKLELVNAENKKLFKDVQALKVQIHALKDKGNLLGVTRYRQQYIRGHLQ